MNKNKIIVNGIDVSKAQNKLEKVLEYIKLLEKSIEIYRNNYYKTLDTVMSHHWNAMWHSTEAYLNDLKNILEVENEHENI